LYSGSLKIEDLRNLTPFRAAQRVGLVFIDHQNQSNFELICKTADQVLNGHSLSTRNISRIVPLVDLCFTQACGFVINIVGHGQLNQARTWELLDNRMLLIFTEILQILNVSLNYLNETNFPTFSVGNIATDTKSETLVILDVPEIRIFTCYVKNYVSYYMYISAFDRTTWIMILLSG